MQRRQANWNYGDDSKETTRRPAGVGTGYGYTRRGAKFSAGDILTDVGGNYSRRMREL
jgi:hypothetical protein